MLDSAKLAFLKAGPELVQLTVEALRTHPQAPYGRPAQASGKTAKAIRFEVDETGMDLLGPRHFETLLTGRKPTAPGAGKSTTPLHEVLEQWAQDKGLQLRGGMSYRQFGFAAAANIHRKGTALYRLRQPSGLLDKVLTKAFLAKLKAGIAAGEMVAISSQLRLALTA